jgi:CubicO group peptidase (beta-lactamase class C family)
MRFLFVLLGLAASAFGAGEPAKIDAFIARYHELGLFNGSALVADHGTPIFRKGYGLANMEWNIPNAPDTKFRLGSITKQFTATLVLQMMEEGKIDLNAAIARYLPDYPKPNGDRITIHQLLNHTSGIPGYTELPQFGSIMREARQPEQFLSVFSGLGLLFEPGTKFSYNNSAFFVLGVILEKLSGKTFEQLLQQQILTPAGMKDTGYDSTYPLLAKRAAGYDDTLDGFRNTSYIDMTLPYSAGSLYSTVEDLYLWDQALYGDKLLKPASKEKMFSPGLSDYGYGVYIRKSSGVTTIEHGGGINGFNTIISHDLESRRLVVLLNNTGGAPLEPMTAGIKAILEGHDPKMPKTPAASVLYKTYQTSGFQAMTNQIHAMQSGADYDAGAGELSRLAGQMISKGKIGDALQIALLAEAAAPKSAGVQAMLGQIHRRLGHRIEAVAAYSRAIEFSDTPRAFPTYTQPIRDLSDLTPKPK